MEKQFDSKEYTMTVTGKYEQEEETTQSQQ